MAVCPEIPFERINIDKRWCVHSYYTLCPWAPDGSGRFILSGCDRDSGDTEVFLMSQNGEILQRYPGPKVYESFWHTGLWQSWSSDSSRIYFQDGSMREPIIARIDIEGNNVIKTPGCMDGCHGEPIISGILGMLYAAGYGTCKYDPPLSPVPFQMRGQHGIFSAAFDGGKPELVLSVEDVLQKHPHRDRLFAEDCNVKSRLGNNEGLTLMLYCVRWNRQGTRFLFYFGNHCVVKDRGEPRLSYVFTSDRDMKKIHLALDLSFGRRGVHWGWHPDGDRLVGYGPDPLDEKKSCLAMVDYTGENYHKISNHNSGGHPSICPSDYNLIVTDEGSASGRILFIDSRNDTEVASCSPGRVLGDKEAPGRNPFRVCHHPVFNWKGDSVMANQLSSPESGVCLIKTPVLK